MKSFKKYRRSDIETWTIESITFTENFHEKNMQKILLNI